MGSDTIPDRANSTVIDQTWFNVLRNVLKGDVVPRDTDGIATDLEGSLGTQDLRWFNAYLTELFLYDDTRSIGIKAPAALASDYEITLPDALPVSGSRALFIDDTGQSTLDVDVDNVGIEVVGSTLQLKDAGVTRSKLAALGQQISLSSGNYTASGVGTIPAITNLSVTITTTGRPVWVGLLSDGSGNASYVDLALYILFKRGATEVARQGIGSGTGIPTSGYHHIDPVAAGTYTYTASVAIDGANVAVVNYAKLIAFEI